MLYYADTEAMSNSGLIVNNNAIVIYQDLPKELERNGRLCIVDLGSNNLQNWRSLQVLWFSTNELVDRL